MFLTDEFNQTATTIDHNDGKAIVTEVGSTGQREPSSRMPERALDENSFLLEDQLRDGRRRRSESALSSVSSDPKRLPPSAVESPKTIARPRVPE